jgi:thioredoxin reductase (NADPH)
MTDLVILISISPVAPPQEVDSLRVDGPYRIVKLNDGTEISCHTLLIACGVSYRELKDVKGIEKLTGSGVYYGASMVDALSYKGTLVVRGEDVFMVGGANSVGQAAD